MSFRSTFLKYFLFFVAFSTILVLMLPSNLARAGLMSSTDESKDQATEEDQEREEDDEDDDDRNENDSGDDLFIPVLFGVSLDDITDNFDDPRDGGSRSHEGLDLLAPEGTPIVSPTEAVVSRVGSYSGAGKYVITENPGDERFYYYHLEDQAEDLERGDEIEEGDLIGYVGDTGNAAPGVTHLHLEIREDRDPKDPYPRITEEYSLEEKMEILEGVLDDADDEEELAEILVENFANVFYRARAAEIDYPEEIEDELPENMVEADELPERDLTVGDRSEEVEELQAFLLERGYININAPTGYFGPITKSALADYQEDFGITPANGYYGAETRAFLGREEEEENEEISQEESAMTEEELRETLVALTAQVQVLLEEINALED